MKEEYTIQAENEKIVVEKTLNALTESLLIFPLTLLPFKWRMKILGLRLEKATPTSIDVFKKDILLATIRVDELVKESIHDVVRGEHCYYCTKCGEAHGDGDGFVGQVCKF